MDADERQQRVAGAVRELLDERIGKGAQARLVEKTGYSDGSVSRMVNGKQPFTDEMLFAVAELIDMPWEQFRLAIGDDLPTPNTSGPFMGFVPVRVIDQAASASVRAGVPVEDVVMVHDTEMRFDASNYKGIRVKGDCMSPEIEDGDVVVIELGAPVESGDIVAAEVLRDGRPEVHVKRLRQRGIRWFLVENNGDSIQIEPENVAGLVIQITRNARRKGKRK